MNKSDVLSRISPQMKKVLDKQNELAGDAFDTQVGFEQMRENYVKERRFWNEGGPVMAAIRETTVSVPDDAPVHVRFYVPSGAVESIGLSPAIVYIHGGGFVVGGPDTHDRITRILAQETGAIVVSVDYPLSPEAKFPQALKACVSVARYLHEQGADEGIDGEDISFAGDSGGASLSLSSFLYLRDEVGECSYVRSLLLYYGMFGLRDSISKRLFGGSWDGMTEADLDYYLECYCGDVAVDAENPYIDCFNADLTQGLPPCYIAAAEFDPLRDDSVLLADIMEENCEPCEFEIFPGVLHAFLHHSRMLDEAQCALDDGARFFAAKRKGA